MKTNQRKNPVARVINTVNRPQTHRDRTKYRRERVSTRNYN
jgi:hypothetical protein